MENKTQSALINAIEFEPTFSTAQLNGADAFEVRGLEGLDDDGNPVKSYRDATTFEQAETDEQAICFGLYYHISDVGADWIADFATRSDAQAAAAKLAPELQVTNA